MPARSLFEIPDRPEMLEDLPRRRYWGDRVPPKNRSEMFSAARVVNVDGGQGDGADQAAASVATLRVYGPIDSWGGWWGVSAKDVSTALDELGDVDEIRLRINSPGGEVWEALAILNMLRAHKARIVAVVDGLAASAASFLAAGCDETVMSPGTQMMIHDARTFAYGPPALMKKVGNFLESTSNSIASLYTEAAGGTDAEWRQLMIEETWYTAQEAADAGLADRVAVVSDGGSTDTAGDEEPVVADPEVEDRFDLSIFNYAGRSHAPAPKSPTASADGSTTTQEGSGAVAFSDEQLSSMRTKLGLAEDADEATILAAFDEALDERAEPQSTNIPEGHVVIPAAKLADLEAGARAGTDAAKRLHDQAREKFLSENATKYAPANRNAWAKEYDRDPEGTRKHFAEAPEIIPVSELGHSSQEPKDDITIDDAELEAFASGLGMSKEDLRG